MGRSKDVVNKILDKNQDKLGDWGFIKHKIESDMSRFLYKETGRNPMVIVHSMNL
jgi:mRNA degradation ribonuclease J1/J2